MSPLKRKQIEELATHTNGPRVSIYLPTHRTGHETTQDPIRFKNLLNRAEADLVALGVRGASARELLKPAWELVDDGDFWLHQAEGLAVFISSAGIEYHKLPVRVDEMEVVASHYHVKPLLELLIGDVGFYILAISLNRIRLFSATREAIRQIELEKVPEELRDAVGHDWEQRSLQFHTGAGPGKGGKRQAMFHGQGSPRDDEKEEIGKFLRLVDDGVTRAIESNKSPIVLAGVGNITAIYRSVTNNKRVLDQGVEGSPDHLSPEDLLAKSWDVMEPLLRAGPEAAAARYAALAGTGRASNDLSEVLRAACEGRVETLFAALRTHHWGSYDEKTWQALVHPERQPGDRDLIDLAVARSLVTGASVYAVEPNGVPGKRPVAAIFRY